MTAAVVANGLALAERSFDDLLAEAVEFHGHLCPGQVLGVRMALAGTREVGITTPRTAGKNLVVFVEIDRCATDAIQALTGVSLGKRTLKHLDYGKMAATFVNVSRGAAVRVVARDCARLLAGCHGRGAPRREPGGAGGCRGAGYEWSAAGAARVSATSAKYGSGGVRCADPVAARATTMRCRRRPGDA